MGKTQITRAANARRGNTGVFLVIVIAVLFAAVYWFVIRTGKNVPDPDTAQGLPVWREWKIREKSTAEDVPFNEQQQKIAKALEYEAYVKDPNNDEDRGEVSIFISPDRMAGAGWSGNYYKKKKINCEVHGGLCEGRVYPGKVYRDGDIEDNSRLYFLTKGKFILHEADFQNTSRYKIRTGAVYIRGWVKQDLSAEGDVTLVGNDDVIEEYSWQAMRPLK